jgi:hypothetical protein
MDKWEPMRGFARGEINSTVLVAYYKSIPVPPGPEHATEGFEEGLGNETESQDDHGTPQRLQINSTLLLSELSTIGGEKLTLNPTVMIPPFKMLLSKHTELEQSLVSKKRKYEMELSIEQGQNPSSAAPLSPEEVGGQYQEVLKRENDKLQLEHLQVLVDFIHNDLKPELELRRIIEQGLIEKIAFKDLWHLFNPGDIVFVTRRAGGEDYERALRVYCVTGGRKSLIYDPGEVTGGAKAVPKIGSADANEPASLFLDCFGIEFNGTHYGPRSQQFYIKPYSGEHAIDALPVYPARFAARHEERLQRLLERGKSFRGLDHVAHKFYEGLTTKDTEEIQGEVVIDFETGYRYAEVDELTLGDLTMSEPRPQETYEPMNCGTPGCTACVLSANYDDTNFDRIRAEQFKDANRDLFHVLRAEHEKIPDIMLQMLPRDVLAYVLHSRSWRKGNQTR